MKKILSPKMLEAIENALNIKFYEWQTSYLLREPMLLDLRITGRRTGKTLVRILEFLFESDEPVKLVKRRYPANGSFNTYGVLQVADWYCLTNRIDDPSVINYAVGFFIPELMKVKEKLEESGIRTREIEIVK